MKPAFTKPTLVVATLLTLPLTACTAAQTGTTSAEASDISIQPPSTPVRSRDFQGPRGGER